MGRKVNFGAGPAALNEKVLKEFNSDLIDFRGSGVGVGELSHRSEQFEKGILGEANERIARLAGGDFDFERDWAVLWMAGGGTGQFAAIPLNFSFTTSDNGDNNDNNTNTTSALYLITGVWSEKAADEAKKLVGPNKIITIDLRCTLADEISGKMIKTLRSEDEWLGELKRMQTTPINYIYYCDNETVDGLELPRSDYFQSMIKIPNAVFVVDSSSNFLSRALPKGASLIFAGVQKNLGAAGVTVVLVKRDLVGGNRIDPVNCPSVLDYKLTLKNNSMLNTPPVMSIHLCNLVLKDLLERFGSLNEIDQFSQKKSEALYEAIERGNQFYCPVSREFRSRMNVIFKAVSKESEVEDVFIGKAESHGMIQLRGHRSVGGLRASLYNAVTFDDRFIDLRRGINLKRFSSKTLKTPAGEDGSIVGPGAKSGTIGSDYEQAVGVERLEMLSKLAGKSIFSSSQLLCHPKGEGIKGTLTDPVLVETLANESDPESLKERIVGCSGVPKGSHEIGFFWLRSDGGSGSGGCGRCPECGQAFKLKPIL